MWSLGLIELTFILSFQERQFQEARIQQEDVQVL